MSQRVGVVTCRQPDGFHQNQVAACRIISVDTSSMFSPRSALKRDSCQPHSVVPESLRIFCDPAEATPGVRFEVVPIHIVALVPAMSATPVQNLFAISVIGS